jgi:hypothetical protein
LANRINWGRRETRTICALTNRAVPTTSNNPIPTVIHVRNPQARQVRPGPGDVDRWVAEAGLEVQVCDDVYRGLGRVIRTRDNRLRAVVVCVDDLHADEFEFFTLIARHRREVSVYVYGGDRALSHVTRAMELGATGEATEAVIGALKTERHEGTETGSHEAIPISSGQAPPRRHEEVGRALPADPNEAGEGVEEETAPACDESAKVEHEELSDGVRVPWLRKADRPARRGPESRSADGAPVDLPCANAPGASPDADWRTKPALHMDAPGTSPDATFAGTGYEPLLTEAELEALMNEDFDELDPGGIDRDALDRDEREMLTGDEAAGEGGRR